MKLVQRIGLAYYRAKLKALEAVSLSKAAESAFELFCTPYTKRKKVAAPAVFEKAERLSFAFGSYTIHGFRWKPEKPNGNKILICHGFDSFSYRFARFAQPLLGAGFEVLAFDAPGHGLSSGKTINALLYSNMIVAINENYGPVNGMMGHSFGGLAAGLAAEKISGDQLKRLVFVAPATETTRSIDDFCRHLKISPRLRTELEKMIVRIGGKQPSWYSVARIAREITIPTLWLHDEGDTITPYADMRYLQNLDLPHVTFIITKGLGHSLYRDDTVARQIIKFFEQMVK